MATADDIPVNPPVKSKDLAVAAGQSRGGMAMLDHITIEVRVKPFRATKIEEQVSG
ncbi:hypothetical protein [Tatumella sp. UCD-D_suzukii]|uniref:hypothetical protein n=1 Tax=Tatumella sp. UCD-D_suzukii TaxID=1408192 RepID=UPI000AF2F44B|nr:hypothetical protein [Tatumella sp. UCD-D_suzukii]